MVRTTCLKLDAIQEIMDQIIQHQQLEIYKQQSHGSNSGYVQVQQINNHPTTTSSHRNFSDSVRAAHNFIKNTDQEIELQAEFHKSKTDQEVSSLHKFRNLKSSAEEEECEASSFHNLDGGKQNSCTKDDATADSKGDHSRNCGIEDDALAIAKEQASITPNSTMNPPIKTTIIDTRDLSKGNAVEISAFASVTWEARGVPQSTTKVAATGVRKPRSSGGGRHQRSSLMVKPLALMVVVFPWDRKSAIRTEKNHGSTEVPNIPSFKVEGEAITKQPLEEEEAATKGRPEVAKRRARRGVNIVVPPWLSERKIKLKLLEGVSVCPNQTLGQVSLWSKSIFVLCHFGRQNIPIGPKFLRERDWNKEF